MKIQILLAVVLGMGACACGSGTDPGVDPDSGHGEGDSSGGSFPDSGGTGGGASSGGDTSGTGGAAVASGGSDAGAPGFPEPLRIVSDGGFTCAIDGDTARCWGIDSQGQSSASVPLDDVVALAGQRGLGALTSSGVAYILDPLGAPPAWLELLSLGPVAHINYDLVFSEDGSSYWFSRGDAVLEDVFGEPLLDAASGSARACGIRRSDQTLVCLQYFPEISCGFAEAVYAPPAGTFSAISSGPYHLCALSTAGAVACWGAGTALPVTAPGDQCFGELLNLQQGQDIAPPGTFRQVSVGRLHACAVRTDGTVACWGAGTTNDDCAKPNVACGQAMPPPDADFVQVAAGYSHSCGLKQSGKVVCWGSNTGGKSTPPPELRP